MIALGAAVRAGALSRATDTVSLMAATSHATIDDALDRFLATQRERLSAPTLRR